MNRAATNMRVWTGLQNPDFLSPGWGDIGTQALLVGTQTVAATVKSSGRFLQKFKPEINAQASSQLHIYPKALKSASRKDANTWDFKSRGSQEKT